MNKDAFEQSRRSRRDLGLAVVSRPNLSKDRTTEHLSTCHVEAGEI